MHLNKVKLTLALKPQTQVQEQQNLLLNTKDKLWVHLVGAPGSHRGHRLRAGQPQSTSPCTPPAPAIPSQLTGLLRPCSQPEMLFFSVRVQGLLWGGLCSHSWLGIDPGVLWWCSTPLSYTSSPFSIVFYKLLRLPQIYYPPAPASQVAGMTGLCHQPGCCSLGLCNQHLRPMCHENRHQPAQWRPGRAWME